MTSFTLHTDVLVPMRDGNLLATDLYLPTSGRPGPTLLTRTSYDKNRVDAIIDHFDLFRALRAGYAVVVQDVRGRFGSEGVFDAYAQEGADGFDAVVWIIQQPWSDGTVGTFGKSYLGCTQWLLAPQQPPGLKAMAPSMTPSDAYEGNTHQGGATVMHPLQWAVGLSAMGAARRAAEGDPIPAEWEADLDVDRVIHHLPLSDHPAYHELARFWPAWISRPTNSSYWRALSPNSSYDKVTVPALNIGGWYDILLAGVLENYRGVRDQGATDAARSNRLVIGPWSHIDLTGRFPDRDFGPAASKTAIDLDGIQLAWFDQWVRGLKPDPDQPDDPVLFFVMGSDTWRTAADWPIPGAIDTDWYLHGDGHANTRQGDGSLSLSAPTGPELADTIVDDPHDPVPTRGGQVLLPGANTVGPRDQADVEDRTDVLVYTSAVLEQPIEVIGPVRLTLHLMSDAPDTDITGKLVDVHPDGRAINLTDGILRVRYRNGTQKPELMQPGEVYELSIDLWATANVFQSGHRILLEVAGSNFPRFGRNSHTGGPVDDEPAEAYRPATISILHDTNHPSRLTLPQINP